MKTLLIIFGIWAACTTTLAHHPKVAHRSATKVVVVKKVKPVKRKVWVPGHWVKAPGGRAWVAGHWRRA